MRFTETVHLRWFAQNGLLEMILKNSSLGWFAGNDSLRTIHLAWNRTKQTAQNRTAAGKAQRKQAPPWSTRQITLVQNGDIVLIACLKTKQRMLHRVLPPRLHALTVTLYSQLSTLSRDQYALNRAECLRQRSPAQTDLTLQWAYGLIRLIAQSNNS